MIQYLLSVWHDDDYDLDVTTDEMERIGPKVEALNEKIQGAGVWLFGGGLTPASSATVVRSGHDDQVSMTDGPYAETKEQMGGFWVIEAADFDEALDWARQATVACELPVEVRPFQD